MGKAPDSDGGGVILTSAAVQDGVQHDQRPTDEGADGTIAIAGNFWGSLDLGVGLMTSLGQDDVFVGLGTIDGAGLGDIFVLKLDPDGDPLVTRSYGGSGGDAGYDIEVSAWETLSSAVPPGPVASGSYFVRVRAAGQQVSEKITLLK
jgi:hypothetical protein